MGNHLTDWQDLVFRPAVATDHSVSVSGNVRNSRDLSPDRNGNGTIDRWERTKECPCFDALHEYEEL